MKIFTIPIFVGAALGALAGWAAINGRGAVEVLGSQYEGAIGVAVVTALMGAIGMVIGLMLWLLKRAFHIASQIERDK